MAVPLQPLAVRSGPGDARVLSAYREYLPASVTARAVACTWQGIPGWPREMRLLPDGCLDLVWDGQHARAVRPAARQVRRPVGGPALVTGIRVRPGWAAVILGISEGTVKSRCARGRARLLPHLAHLRGDYPAERNRPVSDGVPSEQGGGA